MKIEQSGYLTDLLGNHAVACIKSTPKRGSRF